MTLKYYLGPENAQGISTILLRFRYGQKVLLFSTRNKINPKHWNSKRMRAKGVKGKEDLMALNELLNSLENFTLATYRGFIADGIVPTNDKLKERLREFLQLGPSKKLRRQEYYAFEELFELFIADSEKGERLQRNGKRITKQSIGQYYYIFKYIKEFSRLKKFELKVYSIANKSDRELQRIKEYYQAFYYGFTEYLYNDRKYFDNTVGSNIKVIRAFFNYLNEVKDLNIGGYHKLFFVRKEEIPVLVLEPEQLNYLIKDKALEEELTDKECRAKDYFVVGCTFALRVSDLRRITKDNIVTENKQQFLAVTSQKTGTAIKVPIPDYCLAIFEKYKKQSKFLLPPTSPNELNQLLRKVGAKCQWNKPIIKVRERRGQKVVIYKDDKAQTNFQLSDLISMHCARKTAITTLLRMGVPEHVVKSISGHALNSASFHKYIAVAEGYKNQEYTNAIDKMLAMG